MRLYSHVPHPRNFRAELQVSHLARDIETPVTSLCLLPPNRSVVLARPRNDYGDPRAPSGRSGKG